MAQTSGVIELLAGAARARIALQGGECLHWSINEAPLLWTPDPRFWNATAPILFPVCGWTRAGRVRVDGQSFPLGLHGFAATQPFVESQRGSDFVRLELRDNAATRAQYPFAFALQIDYHLTPQSLAITARVTNSGDASMPYALGLHPGFCWPFAGSTAAGHAIVFDVAERPCVPVIAPGGLFSTQQRDVAMTGVRLPLDSDSFAREALCFLDAQSAGLRFVAPDGSALRVEMEGFRHIVLWSRPGAPFLCIENWTGYGDPVDFAGELRDKPSMLLLAPGEWREHRACYRREYATNTSL